MTDTGTFTQHSEKIMIKEALGDSVKGWMKVMCMCMRRRLRAPS